MDKYEVADEIFITKDENIGTVYPENTVIFKVQAFKPSGKYYTSFNLILDRITIDDIKEWQTSPRNASNAYNLFADITNFLRYKRPFYENMILVVNCDSFYPILIPVVEQIPTITKTITTEPTEKSNTVIPKQPCELWGDCRYYENGYCWMHEMSADLVLEECEYYEVGELGSE